MEESREIRHTGRQVLDHLAVGVILVGPDGDVVHRSPNGEALLAPTPLADPTRQDRRLRSLAQRCHATGVSEVENFEPGDADGKGVRLSASPLAGGETVLTVEALGRSKEVEERVRHFVAQVTHDLRTPLTSILGASDLLLSGRVGSPDDRHARLLKIVADGTQKMASLLTQMTARFLEPEGRP